MRYEITPAFESDWKKLSAKERAMFRRAVTEKFNPACDRYIEGSLKGWPKGLRVKSVVGAKGIFEMTWSLAGPDGRATFEWTVREGASCVRWRRIGRHAIFERP